MKLLVLGGVVSGATEALLALKAGGAEVVLLDSNPATLATDPDVAHRTYLEPVTLEAAGRILVLEKPDAVVATLGGEPALALARQLGAVKLLGVTGEGLAQVAQLNAQVDAQASAGWQQAELLVLRDSSGLAEVAGSVEQLSPSLAVTPAQGLTVATLSKMEALALALMNDVALQGLGSVRVAVSPTDGSVHLVGLSLLLPASTALVSRVSGRHLAEEAVALLLGKPLQVRGRVGARCVGLQVRGEAMALGAGLGEALVRLRHALGGAELDAGKSAWAQAELQAVEAQTLRLAGCASLDDVSDAALWLAKAQGFSDAQLGTLWKTTEAQVRARRHARGVRPSLRAQGEVWSLAWDGAGPAPQPPGLKTVLLLGGGPRRVGQGGEVDWTCAHASRALRASGVRVVLLDCASAASPANFDLVCIGAVAREEVLELCWLLQPVGVLAQFGGRAAVALAAGGAATLGTAAKDLEVALDRTRFAALVTQLGLSQPQRRLAPTLDEAKRAAQDLGYPLVARTGSGTTLVNSEQELVPGDLEQFLAEATEADVELLRDATGRVLVAAVLEHVEQAGIHSADAACTLPPHSLSPEVIERLKDAAGALANALNVVGLLNVRFAVQGKAVFVLEANPRVARTVPFVSKATGLQLVELAAALALGATLEGLGCTREPAPRHVAVKEAVFPLETDVHLGTQMKSTGEVMGLSESVAVAFGKSQLAAGTALPRTGKVFLSVQDDDKPAVVDLGKRLKALGFTLLTTQGTHAYLASKRVESEQVSKVRDGGQHIGAQVRAGEVALLINTLDAGAQAGEDSAVLRREASARRVPCFTTVEAARLAVAALEAQAAGERQYRPLQDWLSKR